MAEFTFEFKADSKDKLPMGSKICNIIDGFPEDYGEQTALVYGRLRKLFGEPLYESEDFEDQYSYCINAARDGKTVYLEVYSGPSGPAVGGDQDKDSRDAAKELIEYIGQAEAADYDYKGVYYDGPCEVRMGVKNGVPYSEENEIEE